MAGQHAVVNGQQVPGVVGIGQLLVVDEILQRRADAHCSLLTVEDDIHAAVDIAHDGGDKQHERATHGNERIGQTRRTTGRAAVADASAAVAKAAAMVEIHRAGLTVTLALTAGQLPRSRRTVGRAPERPFKLDPFWRMCLPHKRSKPEQQVSGLPPIIWNVAIY